MKEIAAEKGVPVFQPESINAAGRRGDAPRPARPTCSSSPPTGRSCRRKCCRIPTQGAINVHGSLLPKYRGAAPVAYAILNGETETGVTIIRMSAGLDAGDMLAKAAIPIGDETAGELEAKLAPLGARLAVETIQRMKAGPVAGEKQDPTLVTKAPKLTKEMGLIDWTQPAEQVCRQVRAMQPWPTAYTYLHRAGKPPMRVIINRVATLDGVRRLPDARSRTDRNRRMRPIGPVVWVRAGDGPRSKMLELQPAGKKRMTAEEFLRGHPLKEGDRFGPEVLPGA